MSRRRILVALAAYCALTAGAIGIGLGSGRPLPVVHPAPWLDLGSLAEPVSLALGLLLGTLTIASTRALIHRAAWARALRAQFREVLEGASGGQLAFLGIASGLAEELFFRGAVQPLAGLVLTSLAFGLLHFGPTRAFLPWTLWAIAMGLVLGAIFEATGRLSGPIVAHVMINVVNLRAIARYDARIDEDDGRMAPPRLVTSRRSRPRTE